MILSICAIHLKGSIINHDVFPVVWQACNHKKAAYETTN